MVIQSLGGSGELTLERAEHGECSNDTHVVAKRINRTLIIIAHPLTGLSYLRESLCTLSIRRGVQN